VPSMARARSCLTPGVRPVIAALAASAALALPTAAFGAAVNVRAQFASKHPRAAQRWEYAVVVTNASGRRVHATVFPQVLLGGRVFDTLGSHYTLLGMVVEPYTWSPRLRGRDVTFQVTVFAEGTKVVRRYPFHVR
jgi:hypothetical protein